MSLHPEQAEALKYVFSKGTEGSLHSIRSRVKGTFTEIEALLDSVPSNATSLRPAPSAWSIHEIIDHVVVSHRPAVDELTSLIAGKAPDTGPIPAGLQSKDPFAKPWPELLDDLRAVHRSFETVLAAATDDVPQTARAPVVMVVKCAKTGGGKESVEWVESFDWKAYALLIRIHTLEHFQQTRRTLAAVGELSSPSP